MVLVQFPFVGTKTINGTSRINQKVYHGFNNKLCKVKLLNYSLVFNTGVAFDPMLMRIDSQQLRPDKMPVVDGNFGMGIFIPINNLNVVNDDMSFECFIVGDSITVDLVEADLPPNTAAPYSTNTFLYGHLTFDITPI